MLFGLLNPIPYTPPSQFNRWGSDQLGKFKGKRKAERRNRRRNQLAKASRARNRAQ